MAATGSPASSELCAAVVGRLRLPGGAVLLLKCGFEILLNDGEGESKGQTGEAVKSCESC